MTGLNQGNPGLLDFTQSTILYCKNLIGFPCDGPISWLFLYLIPIKKAQFSWGLLNIYWIFVVTKTIFINSHTHNQLRSSIHYTTMDFIIVKQSGGKLFVIYLDASKWQDSVFALLVELNSYCGLSLTVWQGIIGDGAEIGREWNIE